MTPRTSPLLPTGGGLPADLSHAGQLVTSEEIAGLVDLLRFRQAQSIAIGSGRDATALHSVRMLADAWAETGGDVSLELSWPETAASWLRQATHFAAAEPDVWIMLGPPLGWAQMTRRLLWSTSWKPDQTLLAGGLSRQETLDLVGAHNLPGIAGVARWGSPWYLDHDDQIRIGTRA